MADTIISSSGSVQIESTDGTTPDTIQFSGDTIKRLSDNKEVLFTGDAEPPLGFTAENVSNKKNTINNSATEYPSGAAVLNALNLKLDADKQSINTTVDGLRAIMAPQLDVLYQTTDYGGGNWYWNPDDSTPSNTGTVIKATSIETGRFNRIYANKIVYVTWFGAKGDGLTDDFDAIQKAIDFVAGNGIVVIPGGVYLLSKSLGGGIRLPFDAQGITILGAGKGITTIKLSRNVPRAFDMKYQGVNTAATLYQNITLKNFTVDNDKLTGTIIACCKTISNSVTGNGTYLDLIVGDNTGFLNGGGVYFPLTNSGSAKGLYRASRLKPGSPTTIQVLLNTGENISVNDVVKGGDHNHKILGCFLYGSTSIDNNSVSYRNLNFDNITVENIDLINGIVEPVATDIGLTLRGSTFSIGIFLSSNPTPEYTETLYATNITIKNVGIYGCAAGVFVGPSAGNSAGYAQTFLDNIYIQDCITDTGITPTNQFNCLGYLIGSKGFGNRVLIENCVAIGSADVGFEVNAFSDAKLINCNSFNCYGSGYFTTNYNYPAATMAGTPTTTISHTGGITNTATDLIVASIPTNIAVKGYLTIDDTELLSYVYNGTTTLTVERGLNHAAGISHLNGAVVRFFEHKKQSLYFENCSYTNDALNAGALQGWRSSRGFILPNSPLKLKNCIYNRTTPYLGAQGEALYVLGENTLTNIDGLTLNIVNFNATTVDGQTSSPIHFANNDYGANGVASLSPQQQLRINNINFNLNGILNDGITANNNYLFAINVAYGNYILDWSNIVLDINLSTTAASRLFGIGFYTFTDDNNLYASGTIDGFRCSMTGDSAPTGIFTIDKTFVRNLIIDHVDYTNLIFASGAGNANYRGYVLNAANSANIYIKNTQYPLSYTGTPPILDVYLKTPNTFTSAQIISLTGIGATTSSGNQLVNTTAATNSIQQYSPAQKFTGYGWDNASSLSKPVDWWLYAQNTAGAGNPTSSFNFACAINSGSINTLYQFLSSGTFVATTGAIFTNKAGIGATSGDGVVMQNTFAATSGVPVQYSTRVRQTGTAWNTTTTTSNTMDVIQELRPVTGAVPSSKLVWAFQNIAVGGYFDKLSLSNTGVLGLYGNTSGIVSIQTQAAAGTYNFNLPTTAGTAGQVLTSQGGGSNAMTWATPAVDAVNTATDANYTVTSALQFVKLPFVTANRTVTIPSASSYTGQTIKIWNQNTAAGGFNWSFAGATVKDATNTTITTLANTTVYIIESDGTNWIKMN